MTTYRTFRITLNDGHQLKITKTTIQQAIASAVRVDKYDAGVARVEELVESPPPRVSLRYHGVSDVLEARGTDHETFVRTHVGWWRVQSTDGYPVQRIACPPPEAERLNPEICLDLDLSSIPELQETPS